MVNESCWSLPTVTRMLVFKPVLGLFTIVKEDIYHIELVLNWVIALIV